MSKSIEEIWSSYTVIEEEELLGYLYPPCEFEEGKVDVKNCCIALGGTTIDTESFISYLKDQFPNFVFPEERVDEMEYPFHEAQKRAGLKEDYIRDGLYGELILFTLVDGLLDIPMVCHKLSLQPNPLDEQKASDGVFFGEYEGEESLGMGEAKFFTDRKSAIRDALESTARFYGPEGDRKRQTELSVAAANLSQNLSKSQIKKLSDRLTGASRDYQLIHPIFIGYESEELRNLQTEPMETDRVKERIRDYLEDDDILGYIREKLEEDHAELKRHWLVFMMIPVEDSDEFKKRMKEAIFPYSS